jgi:hypothetical protein
MILSKQNIFSDQQAITGAAASTNVIDTGEGRGIDLGWGTPASLLIQVTEDFAGATGLTVSLQTSDDEAFATSTTVFSVALTTTDLLAGSRASHSIVPYKVKGRYVRLNYAVTGTATAGKVTAGITYGNDETAPY